MVVYEIFIQRNKGVYFVYMNPSFAQTSPDGSPLTKIEQERNEALAMVLTLIREKKTELGTFLAYGKEYPVREGNVSDLMVAKAQSLHRSAQEVLAEHRGLDYRKEEAAAKLENIFRLHEELTEALAELYESNPGAASKTQELMKGVFVQEEVNLDNRYTVAP